MQFVICFCSPIVRSNRKSIVSQIADGSDINEFLVILKAAYIRLLDDHDHSYEYTRWEHFFRALCKVDVDKYVKSYSISSKSM